MTTGAEQEQTMIVPGVTRSSAKIAIVSTLGVIALLAVQSWSWPSRARAGGQLLTGAGLVAATRGLAVRIPIGVAYRELVTTRTGFRAAAVGCSVGLLLAGCGAGGPRDRGTTHPASSVAASAAGSASATSTARRTPTRVAPPPPRRGSGTPVRVSLAEGDGQAYGVAMPIIAYFSVAPTDASVFDKVVTVTVNGKPAAGAWYWERSSQSSQAVEAHYRPAHYWPAHASIRVDMPVAGLWAGPGLAFADSLTLSMKTGAAQLVKIDGKPGVDKMWVYSDGKLIRRFEISLGAAQTPTYLGTAVVISKANPQLMVSFTRRGVLQHPGAMVGAGHLRRRIPPRRVLER